MYFKLYNDNNPPKQGTAKKIYDAFKASGFRVWDLHYNPNLWGRGKIAGWGTWACHISDKHDSIECWCGWNSEKQRAYILGTTAPYILTYLAKKNG